VQRAADRVDVERCGDVRVHQRLIDRLRRDRPTWRAEDAALVVIAIGLVADVVERHREIEVEQVGDVRAIVDEDVAQREVAMDEPRCVQRR
jgi:hypothetical protein